MFSVKKSHMFFLLMSLLTSFDMSAMSPLTDEQLDAIIDALPPLDTLSIAQIKALNPLVIKALSIDISTFTPAQIHAFTSAQTAALTADQLLRFNKDQIQNLHIADIPAHTLKMAARFPQTGILENITTAQIATLQADQVAALFEILTENQRTILAPQQLTQLNDVQKKTYQWFDDSKAAIENYIKNSPELLAQPLDAWIPYDRYTLFQFLQKITSPSVLPSFERLGYVGEGFATRLVKGFIKKIYLQLKSVQAKQPQETPKVKQNAYDYNTYVFNDDVKPETFHYAALGLANEEKSLKTLTAAYRKLSAIHHPDKGGNASIFQKITDANKKIKEWIELKIEAGDREYIKAQEDNQAEQNQQERLRKETEEAHRKEQERLFQAAQERQRVAEQERQREAVRRVEQEQITTQWFVEKQKALASAIVLYAQKNPEMSDNSPAIIAHLYERFPEMRSLSNHIVTAKLDKITKEYPIMSHFFTDRKSKIKAHIKTLPLLTKPLQDWLNNSRSIAYQASSNFIPLTTAQQCFFDVFVEDLITQIYNQESNAQPQPQAKEFVMQALELAICLRR